LTSSSTEPATGATAADAASSIGDKVGEGDDETSEGFFLLAAERRDERGLHGADDANLEDERSRRFEGDDRLLTFLRPCFFRQGTSSQSEEETSDFSAE